MSADLESLAAEYDAKFRAFQIYIQHAGTVWRNRQEGIRPSLRDDEPVDPFRVDRLKELESQFGLAPNPRVLYLGSFVDLSAATAFGKDNVLHVDPYEGGTIALREAGYQAETSTAEDFHWPQPFDLIFLYRSFIRNFNGLPELLTERGLIVAGNGTNDVDALVKLPSLQLAGAFLPNKRHGTWVDPEAAQAELGDRVWAPPDGGEPVFPDPNNPRMNRLPKNTEGLFVLRKI